MSSSVNIESSDQFRGLLKSSKIVIADCKLAPTVPAPRRQSPDQMKCPPRIRSLLKA